MTQRYCPTHQLVFPNEDGSCPRCNPQHRIDLIGPGMKILQGTYQNLAQQDTRLLHTPNNYPLDENFEVKESNQCLDSCFTCCCCIFLLLPAIFIIADPLPEESANITTARYAMGTVSLICLLIVLRWWYRVYQAGGVTTIDQDQTCNWTTYSYLKERYGMCFGLCSKIKRLNQPSGCEFPRFLCLFIIFIVTFVCGILYTFIFDDNKHQ